MAIKDVAVLACLAASAAAQTSVGAYGQCGGSGYIGATACVSAYTCTVYNDYYAQCVPGTAPATATATSSQASSSWSSSSSPTSVAATATSTAALASTTSTASAAASGTATLSSGWYWIRAVESPYYHSYLQSQPAATPAPAVLASPATAGQFNIVDGQLVYNTGAGGQELYMWVQDPTDKTQRALSTWFNTTANPYGTFAFSGDTVDWVDPDVNRGNLGAFYVCPNATTGENDLFINTGAYDYLTPTGCFDVDIHSYGAATATV